MDHGHPFPHVGTPSLGKLQERDLDRRPYIPRGCDAQGQHPEVSDRATADGWEPFTLAETLKFWASVLGVPALFAVVAIAGSLWLQS